MSRSRKHSPVTPHAGGSEKKDKRAYHRRQRAYVRSRLLARDPDGPPRTEHHRSGGWRFTKDGKTWHTAKWMRASWWRK